MNSATLFEEDKWYQIAWVCTSSKLYLYVDGKLDNSIDVPGKVTNLSKTKCKIGNTEYLKADVQMSEFRLWKRALSQREIANNLYATDPHPMPCLLILNSMKGKVTGLPMLQEMEMRHGVLILLNGEIMFASMLTIK